MKSKPSHWKMPRKMKLMCLRLANRSGGCPSVNNQLFSAIEIPFKRRFLCRFANTHSIRVNFFVTTKHDRVFVHRRYAKASKHEFLDLPRVFFSLSCRFDWFTGFNFIAPFFRRDFNYRSHGENWIHESDRGRKNLSNAFYFLLSKFDKVEVFF